MPLFEIMDRSHVLSTVLKFKAFPCRVAFETLETDRKRI